MKKIFLALIICVISASTSAQKLSWNNRDLTGDDYNRNSMAFQNNTDNTIRIVISKGLGQVSDFLVERQSKRKVNFPVYEVTKDYISDVRVKVFYDWNCYDSDIRFAKSIIAKRVRDAENKRQTRQFLRLMFGLAELADDDSGWNSLGEFGNAAMDLYDFYESASNEGIDRAFLDFANTQMRKKGYEKIAGSEKIGTAISNIEGIILMANSNLDIKTDDVEKYMFALLGVVNSESIHEYSIDYSNFKKYVDPDGDGITNRYDECPNRYGTIKCNGCTKEILRKRRVAKRKIKRKSVTSSYPNFMISAYYFHSNFNDSERGILYDDLYRIEGLDVGLSLPILKHRLFSSIGGGFILNGNARWTNFKYKGIEEELNLYNSPSYRASIGYGLMIGSNLPIRLLIEPKYGYVFSTSIESNNFNFSSGGTAPDDYFIIENDDPYTFKSITMRLIIGKRAEYRSNSNGFSASLPISLNFGVNSYDSVPVIVNPARGSGLNLRDGNSFEDPKDEVLFYYFGLSILF